MNDNLRHKKLAKVKYNDNYFLIFETGFNDGFKTSPIFDNARELMELKNDIQVILEDDKGDRIADAICHYGSYGTKEDLWEVMAPSVKGDSVEGHLTWKQVEKHFDKSIKMQENVRNNK